MDGPVPCPAMPDIDHSEQHAHRCLRRRITINETETVPETTHLSSTASGSAQSPGRPHSADAGPDAGALQDPRSSRPHGRLSPARSRSPCMVSAPHDGVGPAFADPLARGLQTPRVKDTVGTGRLPLAVVRERNREAQDLGWRGGTCTVRQMPSPAWIVNLPMTDVEGQAVCTCAVAVGCP